MNNNRPTFGVNNTQTSQNTQTKRTESGAIWKRLSKRDNTEFLSIKINLSKEKLKALLNKEGDTVDIGFVAFTNTNKSDNTKRPDFRVYEDKEASE